jgi:hypothetical protein
MGERVQAPPFVYTVVEAQWRSELGEGGRLPKNRFLFVRISATNGAGQAANIPAFRLESADGKSSYPEETDDMEAVTDWLGLLRSVDPSQTETGYVVFDAPVGAYKLLMYDGSDVENERFAVVEIPVHLP